MYVKVTHLYTLITCRLSQVKSISMSSDKQTVHGPEHRLPVVLTVIYGQRFLLQLQFPNRRRMSYSPSTVAQQLLQLLLTVLQAALHSQNVCATAPQAILTARASNSWQSSQFSQQPSVMASSACSIQEENHKKKKKNEAMSSERFHRNLRGIRGWGWWAV